jgi:hypothetical protein
MENPITGSFSWDLVGDFTGCVAVTMLIMRALAQAGFGWLDRIPSIVEAYVIGALLLVCSDVFLPPPPTVSSIALCLVNGFGVAVTAVGGSAVFGIAVKPTAPDKPK